MLNKILCLLGFHDWLYVSKEPAETIDYPNGHIVFFECQRCGEICEKFFSIISISQRFEMSNMS